MMNDFDKVDGFIQRFEPNPESKSFPKTPIINEPKPLTFVK